MIIDLEKFIRTQRPLWNELEEMLRRLEADPHRRLKLEEVERFHLLYELAASDLARIASFSGEPEIRRYLEGLVARAYGEIHEEREPRTFRFGRWFLEILPRTFRRHARAFWLSVAFTALGSLFGGLAIAYDPEAKRAIMPFPHLLEDPAERVRREEQRTAETQRSLRTTFSAFLMTHNTRVCVLVLALGATWGIGTALVLFYNGVILGAVAVDYVGAGQAKFLLGWLLPHGAVEIPAVLLGGQAGLVLASAFIGWGDRTPLRARLRRVTGDLVTLVCGAAVLLVWAGFVEAFLSQHHEPTLPYVAKIAFGILELAALILFFAACGRPSPRAGGVEPESGSLEALPARNPGAVHS